MPPARKLAFALSVALPLLFASDARGTSLLGVGRELLGNDVPVAISGEVRAPAGTTKPIVVALVEERRDGGTRLDAYWVLHRPGPFGFLRPPGSFYLFAFEDRNEDLVFQPGEPVGWSGTPTALRAARGKPLGGIEVTLPARDAGAAPRVARALAAAEFRALARQRHAGEVLPLGDPRFDAENGKLGLWAPSQHMERFGLGIYFLQPFEPGKVPVLFVHGASGYPQEFADLVGGLDRSRFQPWVFHYPSGQRLEAVSDALADLLDELRTRHRVPAVFVVAHSMGGLVARAAIPRVRAPAGGEVGLFVSISTPWQGHDGARQGVARSPVVVPSWNDMAPGSAFLKAVRASPLPRGVDYHLFFGYRGGESLTLLRQNSDNTVTMQSMLDPAAQEEAVRLHGYFEDHRSILSSADVSRTLNALLSDAAGGVQRDRTSARR
jgi:pimeloyl-ACP methyl ester carboxylesterase